MKAHKTWILALPLLVTVSLSASASHSWNNYHWARTTASFTLKVVDSTTTDWDSELNTALQLWSVAPVLDATVASSDDSNKTRKRCQTVRGQMRVCNAAYGQNGWLGLATIGLDSQGHIDRGTAKMNDSYDWYWTPEEKNHVMCQEIGHVFGLTHTSEDGTSQQTCMDYSTSPDSQWPNDHDYEELALIYSHLDAYNSYDGGTSSGGGDGGVCNAPPGKGCNKNGSKPLAEVPPMGVRVVATRFFQVWVAPRADGGLWIHHLRLAPERN